LLLGIEFLESRLEKYGEISWLRGFGVPVVLAFGPEAAQEVFANDGHVFSQQGAEFFLGRFFKRGLMFLDSEEHRFHRRIMQEAFTRERLRGYLDSIDEVGRAAAAALSGDELLVHPYLKRTLLDIATVRVHGRRARLTKPTDGEGLHGLFAHRLGCGSVSPSRIALVGGRAR